MLSAFNTFGKLGALASSVARAWSPLALWPTGTEPGMWISPSTLPASFNDSTGTTPVATPGTVADSANPVGLALDIRAGATALADPGNHMLQASTTARPLLSARVNLLTYSEDFSVKWAEDGAVLSGNTLTETTADGPHRLYVNIPYAAMGFDFVAGTTYTYEVELKAGTSKYAFIYCSVNADVIYVDLEAGTIFSGTGGSIKPGTDGSFIVSVTGVFSAYPVLQVGLTNASHQDSYVGNTANSIEVIRAQVNYGNPTDYQAILTDGSSYSPTGITPFQLYDGTDDGMATATFSAGTLIDGMDCLIPVRRDSAANAVCGLYESVAEANKVFGIAESGSSSGCVGSGAGTPTVWVDNTQLTGGTAVTRGTLHTALTAGDWHILEFRNLDLSTWTASGFGLYTSYKLLGGRSDIMLFPSPADATERDKARAYLADLYGVTLP